MVKFNQVTLAASIGALLSLSTVTFAGQGLTSLSDEEMAKQTGQVLFNASYLAPSDSGNFESANNVGFYKLGLEAELQINANIKKLQLGCGGVNGANGCDIDIDNLSLSGNSATREGRVGSDAVLTNPFIEFAIKNPDSASLREVVGFRVSSEKMQGLLTAGTANSSTANGINSISGYMKVQSDPSGIIKGYAKTMATRDNLYGPNEVQGTLQALGLGGVAEADFKTTNGGFNVPAINNNYFETPAIKVNGTRIKSVTLSAPVKVPNIYVGNGADYPVAGTVQYNATPHQAGIPEPSAIYTQGGPVEATVTQCRVIACLIAPNGTKLPNVYMNGTISNITANLNLQQSLGLIHSLPIDSPFYLSLQKNAMHWPGAKADDIAQKGWWLSLADPVNIGNVNLTDAIDISPLFPQISTFVSQYLQANPAKTNDLAGLLNIGDLTANIGTIDLKDAPLTLNLSNLQLTNQDFVPNCYGGLTFC
ncbi:hypothetical protein [Alkanindiges illinoisensis]|uniref:Uncharacterized protein n=1 Tax=Alkanindiges illinoisensis TaxID=197183 RepID=A0A4Y7XBD9_9GAMM|nr:hypothetical protein [Alkanindiges illinoisensis]TEU24774.1 hypothetical protein E2B99_11830 [Alkanindiges illinoisensis]